MRVVFHPEFPKDIWRFASDYGRISDGLAARFRREIDEAVNAIKLSPTSAGHFLLNQGSARPKLRRKNLRSFPFFVLYGIVGSHVIIASLIPSRSDPLTWLSRVAEPDA